MAKRPKLILVEPGANAFPPPRKLGRHGLALWNRVQNDFGIQDVGGVELLCLACQGLDRAESLAAAINSDGETVRTRTGVKAHPALRDELAARAFVVRTLAKLGITSEPVKPVGRPNRGIGWTGDDADD
jgi:hypothetical protein